MGNNKSKTSHIERERTRATLSFSKNLASHLHNFLADAIGDLSKVTDYNYVHDKLSIIGPAVKFSRIGLESFPSGAIHIATIYCDTKVEIFIYEGNMVGDKPYYVVVE